MSVQDEPGPRVSAAGGEIQWMGAGVAQARDPTLSSSAEAAVEKISTDWVTTYQRAKRETCEAYAHVGPLWRLKVSDPETLVSQVVCLAMFGVWWFLLPRVHFGNVALISQALAAPAGATGFDPKPWIHMAIFVALFVTFVVSIWVNYFSKSEKAADQAGTVSKTLLGFFIGAATNYLGITAS